MPKYILAMEEVRNDSCLAGIKAISIFFHVLHPSVKAAPTDRLNQHNRGHDSLTQTEQLQILSAVQFFQIVYQTDRSFACVSRPRNLLSGLAVNSKQLLPLNKCINSCQFTYFFIGHLFFITLLTTRMEDTGLFVK